MATDQSILIISIGPGTQYTLIENLLTDEWQFEILTPSKLPALRASF